jgi:putative aminopeptidase FrvX
MEDLFEKLVAIPSISGNESLFQQLVAKEFSEYSQVKFSDVLNNFTVQIGEGSEKVLITAHADEVGFIVTYISDDGFIYFQPVGGIDPDIAVGQIVTILTANGPISGIIGKEEVWDTASAEPQEKITPYKELWIDIGAGENTSKLVSVGDVVFYDTGTRKLPDPYRLARGADDKLGVYSLIELVRSFAKEPNANVSLFAVTTTQEEIGSRGAQPVVTKIAPQYSIIIDTIAATDTPIADREELGDIRLDAGPAISRGSNTNPDLFVILQEIAKREKIPFQIDAEAGPTSTDADPIQVSGIGTATIVVSIPVRYSHFPGQVFSWNDVENCIKLVSVFLKSLRVSN